jgi:hypothetical protein
MIQSIVGRELLEVFTIRVAIRSNKADKTEFVDRLLLICRLENKETEKRRHNGHCAGGFASVVG